jgi:hypothetical protein
MGNCCAAAKPDQDDVERGGQETAGDSSPIQKVKPTPETMGNCCAAAKPDQDDVERGGQETAGDSSPIQKVNPDEKEAEELARIKAKKKAQQNMDSLAGACHMASRCSIM